MDFIDTHAHLYLEHFSSDIAEVIQRARDHEVSAIYLPNIDRDSIDSMIDLEKSNPGYCMSMIGLHPCSVNLNYEKELKNIRGWLEKRKFVAIGEIGTDLYWDKTFIEQQEDALKIQIEWAKEYMLPIVLHSRDSLDKTIDIIERYYFPELRGIFHCFTGDLHQAEKIMDLGFLIGVGGVSTFKNSKIGDTIKDIPLECIVLETDSPYLSPTPHRGKRNEPSYIPIIAEKLASLTGRSLSDVAHITTENANNIFKK